MKKITFTDEEIIILNSILYNVYKHEDNTKYAQEKMLGILRKTDGDTFTPMVSQLSLSDIKYFIKHKDNINFNVVNSILSLCVSYLLGSEDAGITRINYHRKDN